MLAALKSKMLCKSKKKKIGVIFSWSNTVADHNYTYDLVALFTVLAFSLTVQKLESQTPSCLHRGTGGESDHRWWGKG